MTNKSYYIEYLKDIVAIPEDRIDDFLVELKEWYHISRSTKKLRDTITEVTGAEVRVGEETMTWIDDGKRDVSINIHVRPENG